MIDGPYHRSLLPAREREAARLPLAQLNDCPLCRDFRARSARAGGAADDLYAHVDDPDQGAYTERERLAIEFAERFALDHAGFDNAFFTRLRAAYADGELLAPAPCSGAFLGLGRAPPRLPVAPRPRAAP